MLSFVNTGLFSSPSVQTPSVSFYSKWNKEVSIDKSVALFSKKKGFWQTGW